MKKENEPNRDTPQTAQLVEQCIRSQVDVLLRETRRDAAVQLTKNRSVQIALASSKSE